MSGGGPSKTKIILKDEMPMRGYSHQPKMILSGIPCDHNLKINNA
jgi:hypothetical protein